MSDLKNPYVDDIDEILTNGGISAATRVVVLAHLAVAWETRQLREVLMLRG